MKKLLIKLSAVSFSVATFILLGATLGGSVASAQVAPLSILLTQGVSGSQVVELQMFLSKYPQFYPSKLITGYFGPLTAQAVKNFQTANNLPATGSVDANTRAAINSQFGALPNQATQGSTTSTALTASNISFVPYSTYISNPTFSWTTSAPAFTTFYYATSPLVFVRTGTTGPEQAINGFYVIDSTLRTDHSFELSGLAANTTYYYDIVSTDASGNNLYTQGSFVTSSK